MRSLGYELSCSKHSCGEASVGAFVTSSVKILQCSIRPYVVMPSR